MITTRRRVPLLDLPASERLDSTLGLRAIPRMPLGRRTGLFLLALRPVEFSANPIAAYPTTIAGPRQVEDSEVIEATAITLIPYPDTGGAATLAEARRYVARKLFLGEAAGLPQDALPLAMVAMERGSVRWVDVAMVRRETGADTPLAVSMGARPRALAEAYVLQYRGHLADVLADRARSGTAGRVRRRAVLRRAACRRPAARGRHPSRRAGLPSVVVPAVDGRDAELRPERRDRGDRRGVAGDAADRLRRRSGRTGCDLAWSCSRR